MFVTEKTYDFKELVKCNMHTHSTNSLCSKPEMIFEDMVKEAERIGLETLAITDHSDLGSGIDVVANAENLKERLKALNTPVRVLLGAELSAYGIGKYAESRERDKALDFSSYSCVHYHLHYWEQPEDRSPRGYAKHMLAVLDELFTTDRADCIAHPFSPGKMKFFSDEEKIKTLASITDNELGDILEKGEKAECAWEIHTPTFLNYTDFSKRMFSLGKEAGVHFVLGTDAHNLKGLNTFQYLEALENVIR
ncbi:MAG: PHP domain-containing protein [Clostridia bacterium]|nr:PHP domain-containing protein [Clostridia bacterium]